MEESLFTPLQGGTWMKKKENILVIRVGADVLNELEELNHPSKVAVA